ncbi:MAG: helix-turn-helix domain-containing protein [Acidimicrobiales bacterium]
MTHVLLPTFALLRRRDVAAVIGEALRARHLDGASRRAVAAGAGVHPDTARGWLRRFVTRAEDIRVAFSSLAHRLDAELGSIEPRGSPLADALEAIGVAAAAATRRLGPAPLWEFVAGASGGRLLANTSCPLPR